MSILCYFALHQNIRLEAGYALSLFAYNNRAQQEAILKTGGIPIALYEPLLTSENEIERTKAAFQVRRPFEIETPEWRFESF